MIISWKDVKIQINNQFPEGTFFTLYFAGRQSCEAGHRYRGMRNYFLLHYIEDGSGTVGTSAADAVKLETGNCFLFPPHSPIYYRASDDNPWTYRWIAFYAGQRQRLLSLPGRQEPAFFNTTPDQGILPLIDRIMHQFKSGRRDSEHRNESLFLELAAILLKRKFNPDTGDDSQSAYTGEELKPDYIAEAKNYIRQRFDKDISTEDVARYIGLERSYFSKLFSKQTGGCLRDYIIEVRMNEACRLLDETEFTIKAVAASVGYDDYSVFARRFKNYTGLSAGEWRSKKVSGTYNLDQKKSVSP